MPTAKIFKDWMSAIQYCKKHKLNWRSIYYRIYRWTHTLEQSIEYEKKYHNPLQLPWEEWREVKWYEWYYEVSNLWRVRSYWKRSNKWSILMTEPYRVLKWWKKKQTTTYLCHTLFTEFDRKRHYKTSRLVAQAFMWVDYNDKMTLVCHKNDDGLDNRLENLFLWTHKQNTLDSIEKGRCKLIHIKSHPRFNINKK